MQLQCMNPSIHGRRLGAWIDSHIITTGIVSGANCDSDCCITNTSFAPVEGVVGPEKANVLASLSDSSLDRKFIVPRPTKKVKTKVTRIMSRVTLIDDEARNDDDDSDDDDVKSTKLADVWHHCHSGL